MTAVSREKIDTMNLSNLSNRKNVFSKSFILAILLVLAVASASAYTSPSSEGLFLRGNDTQDYSGNGNHGTLNGGFSAGNSGGVVQSGDNWDTGLTFSSPGSSGDHLNVGNAASLDSTNQFSFSVWVKPDSTSSTQEIISKWNGSDSVQSYLLRLDGTGTPQLITQSDSSQDTAAASSSVTAGAWNHLVVTYDQGAVNFYINNSSAGGDTGIAEPHDVTTDVWIGENDDTGNPFAGDIDDLHYYGQNKVLTTSEISNLYQYNQLSEPETNPTSISNIECELDGSWQDCSNAGFGDTVTQVRANVTDDDGVADVSFTLEDQYDSNIRFQDQSYTSTSGDYYIYDNTDQTVDDSGDWSLTVNTEDINGNTDSGSSTWSVSWGSLSATLDKPSSDISVEQDSTFNMTGTASCSGGECASEGEQVELWADPVWTDNPIKLESSEGQVSSGDTVQVSGKYQPSTARESDIVFRRGEDNISELIERQKNADVSHDHSHSEQTHTHGEDTHSHSSGSVLDKILKPVTAILQVF